MLGEQLLEVLLDAVLLQAGVDAELVGGVVQDLLEEDPQGVVGPCSVTVHSTGAVARWCPRATVHGGDIQFSGL